MYYTVVYRYLNIYIYLATIVTLQIKISQNKHDQQEYFYFWYLGCRASKLSLFCLLDANLDLTVISCCLTD